MRRCLIVAALLLVSASVLFAGYVATVHIRFDGELVAKIRELLDPGTEHG